MKKMKIIINDRQFKVLIEGKTINTPEYIKQHSEDLEKKYLETNDTIIRNSTDYKWLQSYNPKLFKIIRDDRDNKYLSLGIPVTSRIKDLDGIKKDAKKYKDYTKFVGTKTYFQARRVGPCYDKNGNEVKCYITKEDYGVIKNPYSVRNSLEFFNEITSGMTRSDFGPKMVYSYTFFDDENKVVGVYVGITNDEERRKGEHLTGESTFTDKEVKSAVSKFIKENPLFRVEYKSLTEYIPFVDAQVKEEEYVNNAKSNGYNVLNIAKTGSGGASFGVPDKYLIDKVNDWIKMKEDKDEELLLKSFRKYDANTYNRIIDRRKKGNQKLYDETLGKLIRSSKTEEELITKAMSCNSYSEFYNKFENTFYKQARRKKILPKIEQMFADGLNTPD